ncbi:Signal peptidase family protein [Tenacibaculum maritimum]|nr:Signal peptidase family protein [Tenacibaculum maritimum]
MKKLLFFIGSVSILFFYRWSRLIVVSLLLLLIVDSFTIKVLFNNLKRVLPKNGYKILRWSYMMVLPVFFGVFFRTFFFDIYFVPSSSMEKTLFPDDYVLVNKISYGVKIPKHLRNVPLIGSFFTPPENEYNLYETLRSYKKIQQEDIVVFKAVDGSNKFLIKRIIGMPSDTLQIERSEVFINSKKMGEKESYSYNYIHNQSGTLLLYENYSNKEFSGFLSAEKKRYRKDIKRENTSSYSIFPFAKQEKWTRDNYGSLIIPKKGMVLCLTKENINLYKESVFRFESIDLEKVAGQFYTFKNNYYFVMGDNRHNSIDSRTFGFVPESYIQGKMVGVFSRRKLLDYVSK